MAAGTDLQVILRLLRGMPRRGPAAQRLEDFYAPQARAYDDFRERLLPGRRELIERLPIASGARVVELGAGTGRNLDYLGPHLASCASVELVDLCPAMLNEARRRAARHPNVRVVEADAAAFQPDSPADLVLFSYSLTMMSDWRDALANAVDMLKPQGRLAVVDFTATETQGPVARAFWRYWFGHDGVHLTREHTAALQGLFPVHWYQQRRTSLPYLHPALQVPYYLFIAGESPLHSHAGC